MLDSIIEVHIFTWDALGDKKNSKIVSASHQPFFHIQKRNRYPPERIPQSPERNTLGDMASSII